jgi:hypothetical protein
MLTTKSEIKFKKSLNNNSTSTEQNNTQDTTQQYKLTCYYYNDGDNNNYFYVYGSNKITRIKKLSIADLKRSFKLVGVNFTESQLDEAHNNLINVIPEYTVDYSYLAIQNRGGYNYINLFDTNRIEINKENYKAKQGDIKNWFTLLANIYGDDYQNMDNYIAYQVNNLFTYQLGECLTGYKSTGKTLYFKVKSLLLGKENCTEIDGTEHDFKFNGVFSKKLQILIDEAYITQDSIISRLKAQITNDKINIERKGQERITEPFIASFGITSEKIPSKLASEMQGKRVIFRDCKIVLPNGFYEELLKEIPAIKYYYLNHSHKNIIPNRLDLIKQYSQYEEIASTDITTGAREVLTTFINEVDNNKIEGAIIVKQDKQGKHIKLLKKHLDTLNLMLQNEGYGDIKDLKDASPFYSFKTFKDFIYGIKGMKFNNASFINGSTVKSVLFIGGGDNA